MSKEHLQRLEWAKQEVQTRVSELDERRRKQEIGGIEHKILLHEKLFGRERDEFVSHIDSQISETRNHLREQREIKIAVIVTLLAMALAFGSTLYTPEAPTGFAVQEDSQVTLTDCWNNTPPTEGHTTPNCTPAENIEEK